MGKGCMKPQGINTVRQMAEKIVGGTTICPRPSPFEIANPSPQMSHGGTCLIRKALTAFRDFAQGRKAACTNDWLAV